MIRIPVNTFRVLPCKLRSNLAERRWEYSKGAGRFLYPSSDGGLVVVAQTDREESYQCWSVEKGFWQLQANYCVKAEPQHESTRLIGSSHTLLVPEEKPVILPGEACSSVMKTQTYWNELIVVCTLLCFSILVFSLFVIYQNRDHMKSIFKQSECPDMQQKKAQLAEKPTESLPLNGNNVLSSVSDHKGYQSLYDNYFCSTPTQEYSSPDNSKSFSESEQHPLQLKDTHVEISPTSPSPRVRLSSEIKDSMIWDSSCNWQLHWEGSDMMRIDSATGQTKKTWTHFFWMFHQIVVLFSLYPTYVLVISTFSQSLVVCIWWGKNQRGVNI